MYNIHTYIHTHIHTLASMRTPICVLRKKDVCMYLQTGFSMPYRDSLSVTSPQVAHQSGIHFRHAASWHAPVHLQDGAQRKLVYSVGSVKKNAYICTHAYMTGCAHACMRMYLCMYAYVHALRVAHIRAKAYLNALRKVSILAHTLLNNTRFAAVIWRPLALPSATTTVSSAMVDAPPCRSNTRTATVMVPAGRLMSFIREGVL